MGHCDVDVILALGLDLVFLTEELFPEPDLHCNVAILRRLQLHATEGSLAVLLAVFKRLLGFFMLVDKLQERIVANTKHSSGFPRCALDLSQALYTLDCLVVRQQLLRPSALVFFHWLRRAFPGAL